MLGTAPLFAHAQSLTIQGKVFDGANRPVAGAATRFRVKILSPDTQRCVLFDETHTLDLSSSQGLFSINLANGSGTPNSPTTYGLDRALSNRAAFTVDAAHCAGGLSGPLTYTPGANDNRKVVIEFLDPVSMGSTWETIPEMDVNPVAWAMESRTVGGFPATSLLRVVGGGVPGSAPTLTSAEVSELQALAAGTSVRYMQRGTAGGAQLPVYPGNPSSPSAGSIWFDTTAGGMKFYDGTTVHSIGTGSGTINSVTGGDGISASVTGGTATVSLAPSGVGVADVKGTATMVPRISYDTYGRILGITEQAITGTLPGAGTDHQVLKSTAGAWGASFVGIDDLRKDASTPLFPGVCTASQTLRWNVGLGVFECAALSGLASSQLAAPSGAAAGTYRSVTVNAAGQVLSGTNPTDLAGYAISDAVRNGGSVPQIRSGAADPSGAGVDGELYVATGSQKIFRYKTAAPAGWELMASAGGAGGTLSDINAGTGIAVSGTGSTRTVSLGTTGVAAVTGATKITTDATGRVTAGGSLADTDIPSLPWSKIGSGKPTDLAGYGIGDAVRNDGAAVSLKAGVTGDRPTPGVAGEIFIDTTTNSVWYRTASSWVTVGTGSPAGFTGALNGEIDGGQSTTSVKQIGSYLRTALLSLLDDVKTATATKTNDKIVKRDATGGFAAGAVTVDSVIYKGATSGTATLRAPATVTSYDVQLPAAAPAPGQVLTATSGTALSWSTPLSGSGITVAAPITNSSGTIGINTASGSQAGALSSGDWTTFNNKLGTALTAASIWVGNASNVATAVAPSGDVAVSNTGAFTVNGIKGQNISAAGTAVGQMLRYAGTNTWTPGFVSMADLRSTVTGTTAITGNCTASQTLTWNSGSDNLQCQSISIAAATQITGVLPIANGGTGANSTAQGFVFAGPASGGPGAPSFRALAASDVASLANQWSELSGNVFRNGGSVGIGTSAPQRLFHMQGNNATWRMDRDQNTVGIQLHRFPTNDYSTPLKGFMIGVDASAANNGTFSISDYGQSVGGPSTQRLLIDTNGRTGIGTTTPGTSALSGNSTSFPNAMLDVAGEVNGQGFRVIRSNAYNAAIDNIILEYATNQTTRNASVNTGWSIRAKSPASSGAAAVDLGFYSGYSTAYVANDNAILNSLSSSPTLLLSGSGNVGIATATPASKLHVASAPTASANYGLLSLGSGAFDGTTAGFFTGSANGTLNAGNAASGFTGDLLHYQVGGASRFRVDAAGNITTAGTFTASAAGNSNINTTGTGNTVINGGTNTGTLTLGNSTGGVTVGGPTSISSTTASTSSTTGALRVSGGLGVAGDIFAGATINALTSMMAPQIYGSTAANGTLKLDGTSHANKGHLLLNSAGGNVGIGTTVPTSKLTVAGAAMVYGTVGGGGGLSTVTLPAQGTYLAWNEGLDGVTYLMNHRGSAGGGFKFGLFDSAGAYVGTPVTISGGGNVGIGTTSPGYAVDVNTANTNAIRISSSAVETMLDLGNYSSSGREWRIATGGASGSFAGGKFGIYDKTATTVRLAIDSAGSVGFGTLSPAYRTDIQFTGDDGLRVKNTGSSHASVVIDSASAGGASYIRFQNDGANKYWLMADAAGDLSFRPNGGTTLATFKNGGNVGIGTSSPTARLEVTTPSDADATIIATAGNNVADAGGSIGFVANKGSLPMSQIKGLLGFNYNTTEDQGGLGFFTRPTAAAARPMTERMRISAAGNVGIGTNNPTSTLTVAGSAGTSAGPATLAINPNTTGVHSWATSALNSSMTTGHGLLHLIGQAGSGYNSGYLAFRYAGGSGSTSNYMSLGLYGVDNILNVTGEGRVGIGTTAPATTFEARGSVNLGTNIYPDGVVNMSSNSGDAKPTLYINGGGVAAGEHTLFTRARASSFAADVMRAEAHRAGASSFNLIHAVSDGGTTPVSRFLVRGDGNVGIGTNAPAAPLHVASTVTQSVCNYQYINGGNTTAVGYQTGCQTPGVSILASGRIVAPEVNATSDRRVKENIVDIPEMDALRFLEKTRPVHYRWTIGEKNENYGFLAQDLDKAGFHEAVSYAPDASMREVVDTDGYLSPAGFKLNVNYNQLTALLTKAMQDFYRKWLVDHEELAQLKAADAARGRDLAALRAENEALKARALHLEKENQKRARDAAALESRLERLEKRLAR